jgi:hypothetical protein
VAAAIEVKRATGEPFAGRPLTGVVTVDDVELARLALKTDGDGKATAKFALPAPIARGDGLLTILADDGGVTESIQKRSPIVMSTLSLQMFPEGGDLVDGLPGRVYPGQEPAGKPADIRPVVDDAAKPRRFCCRSTAWAGSTPALTDRSFKAVTTRPPGSPRSSPAARLAACCAFQRGAASASGRDLHHRRRFWSSRAERDRSRRRCRGRRVPGAFDAGRCDGSAVRSRCSRVGSAAAERLVARRGRT